MLLLAGLLLAFGLRVQGLTRFGLWRDEVDAIYFGVRPLAETLAMFVNPAQNGPLYFVALRPWFGLVGTGEFALRFPSVWGGVLAVALLWSVGRLLLPADRDGTDSIENCSSQVRDLAGTSQDLLSQTRRVTDPARAKLSRSALVSAPLWAALFLAVNPYQLWYGQEGKMYALIVALSLLSARLWLVGMARGGWRPWLGYVIVTSLGFYTHLFMILHIPLHFVWYLIARRHSPGRRGYPAALAGLTLPYLPMLLWQWDFVVRADYTTGFSFIPLGQMVRTLIFVHNRGFLATHWAWMIPGLLLAVAGLLVSASRLERSPRTLALITTWLAMPVLTIYAISLIKPVFVDRYVIWIAPALFLLMALGIQSLANSRWLKGVGLVLGLIVGAIWLGMGIQQSRTPLRADLRGAVALVESQRQPGDLLILQVPHMAYSYAYYTSDFGPNPFQNQDQRLAPWAEGLWTNNGFGLEVAQLEVDRSMQAMTTDHDRIWLLRSEADLWDQRGLMDAWLDTHFSLTSSTEFSRAEVRLYEGIGDWGLGIGD
ncbi:MAG: hypothetical protein KBG20_13590 [Caldilineaceae bacterium]|nr:hypothetical protein [Caldilineaceae bacterium]MBP8108416.1 hypothetical protein [Caldilineaceae bacterium]MBP8124576.1 hypothetical protein [Caldilineaceae bacterium]MBP9073332.1 hypothetical protein [Caldilineaceae bacterium]